MLWVLDCSNGCLGPAGLAASAPVNGSAATSAVSPKTAAYPFDMAVIHVNRLGNDATLRVIARPPLRYCAPLSPCSDTAVPTPRSSPALVAGWRPGESSPAR